MSVIIPVVAFLALIAMVGVLANAQRGENSHHRR